MKKESGALKMTSRPGGFRVLYAGALYVILIMASFFGCWGCRGIKDISSKVTKDSSSVVSSNSSHTKDSNTAENTNTSHQADAAYDKHTETDSAYGVHGTDIKLHVGADQLGPNFDKHGVPVSNMFLFGNDDAHGSLTINADGSADIDCKTDSLTLVIKGLIRDSIYRGHTSDSLIRISLYQSHIADSLQRVITDKEHSSEFKDNKVVEGGWIDKVKNVLAIIGLIAVVYIIIKKAE